MSSLSANALIVVSVPPLAVLGVPPVVYAVASLVNLLYQVWIHTVRIGKLGWFDLG